MALPTQIDAAAHKPQPVHNYEPVNADRVDAVPDADPNAFPAAREYVKRLGNRHRCTGVDCRRRGHKRDVEATSRVLIILGLADDPTPSVQKPRRMSPTVTRTVKEGSREHRRRLAAAEAAPLPDWAWADRAACRGEDVDLFIPPDGERTAEREIREAKALAICDGCPVIDACLDTAVRRRDVGVWGGMNDYQRTTKPRRRTRQASAA